MLSCGKLLLEGLEFLDSHVSLVRQGEWTGPNAARCKHKMFVWDGFTQLGDDFSRSDLLDVRADDLDGRVERAVVGNKTTLINGAVIGYRGALW